MTSYLAESDTESNCLSSNSEINCLQEESVIKGALSALRPLAAGFGTLQSFVRLE